MKLDVVRNVRKVYHWYQLRDPKYSALSRLPKMAEAYRRLDPVALLFDRVEFREQPRAVALLLPSARRENLFAGAMTGLRFATTLASELAISVRVIVTDRGETTSARQEDALRERLGTPSLRIDNVGAGATSAASRDDVWVASYWTTALALDVAARCGLVNPERVIYLVQDYEPGFTSWSTEWAVARTTYHAGFHHVVNSSPLARYLREQEGPIVADDHVMAPDLDIRRLQEVAQRRLPRPLDVFFYARPSTPRNMYQLGLAAAHRAAGLTQRPWRLVLAGEVVPTPDVPGVEVVNLGRTNLDGYFDLMARTPVALSLMMSPHPSHPPLDWAISGGWAVTNNFGDSRKKLHPRVLTADAHPDALGRLLANTIDTAETGRFMLPATLGRSMFEVVHSLAQMPEIS